MRSEAKRPFRLEVPPDVHPIYVNLARIGHTPSEFVLDLARFLPGEPAPRLLSRVVLSPQSAKLLYRALGENLAKYEAHFGEIPLPGGPSLADLLFRPQQPPEPPAPPPDAPDADA